MNWEFIRPLHNRVVLEKVWLGEDQQYPHTELLKIPDAFQHYLTPWGIVRRIGPDCVNGLKVGDKVKYNPLHACHCKRGDAKFAIVAETEIDFVIAQWPEHAITREWDTQELINVR
jgi:co-chaperonin GroES (HSP10)